jgi:hypothetical protein
MNANESSIPAVLTQYEDALNRSDTDAVMKLYAPDALSCRSIFRLASAPIRFAITCPHQLNWINGQHASRPLLERRDG